MTDQSGESRFQALFEAAFRDYESQTGKTLANHPLADQLQSCDSVESITAVFCEQTEGSSEIRGNDKVLKPLKNVLSVLYKLSSSSAVNFGQHLGLPLPPLTAIHTGLGILLSAVKGVLDDYDTLADLLQSVEHFLNRLDIYTKISPTVSMTEIIIKILVQVLSILALATKQLQQGKLKALVKKKLLGGKDIEAVLQRLDRLTEDEARITAAQTLEVVYGLFQNMRDVVDDGKTSINHVRDALEIMQKLASDMNKSKRDKLEQDIRRWLSPPDPWKNHNIACRSRHSGSATWFLEGSTYSEWKASEAPGSLLWVHGKPGAGKSVLCSTIIGEIDAMRKAGLASLAFFYCDFREDQKRDLRGLLSSFLVQLCHQSDSYSDILSKLYSEHANGSCHPSLEELAGFLKDLLKVPRHAPVYLIVDALDECPNTSSIPSPRDDVLNLIEELINSQIPHLRVCVTSRPETDIKDILDPLVLYTVSLHDEGGQNRDIDEYIKSVINTNPKNKRWKAEDKQLVIDVLTSKAAGMFRWVYCQLVHICGCLPARIRHALADLPETLDETYERTLREINKADWEFAHRLFQFVAVAVRPLFVEELAELLAFDFEEGLIPKFRENWRLEDPMHAVLSSCCSFLALVENKSYIPPRKVVQFSHFSVKEFLTSTRLAEANDTIFRRYHISETPAHTLAARACLGYLLHLDEDIIKDGLKKLPFIRYSAEYWVDHARLENVSRNVSDGMKELFDPSKPHLAIHVRIRARNPVFYHVGQSGPPPLSGTRLHYAVLWDLPSMTEIIVNEEHSQNVNSHDFTNSATPLHLASKSGHLEVARILIEGGADVSALDDDGRTTLHLASQSGHLEVARMLVERDADVSAQDDDGRTTLHLASKSGHLEVARILIEGGADVSAQDEDGRTPLHLASKAGRLEVARMLIEGGADVSALDNEGQTPLQVASGAGEPEVAHMLIERGAAVLTQDEGGWTPLHQASHGDWNGTSGHLEVARMLIERGADASGLDQRGQTPLHLALEAGQLEVARVLIEVGVSVSAQNEDGQTPLHLVSLNNWNHSFTSDHPEIARMLIERGADVPAQNKDGRTPLHLASEAGELEVARMLIECGADLSARDKDDQTALHLALQAVEPETWKIECTEEELADYEGDLEVAKLKVARMLIERGADLSAQDKDGRTALHLAMQAMKLKWCEPEEKLAAKLRAAKLEVARMLIERGVDLSAQDKDGLTVLHLALQAVDTAFQLHGEPVGEVEAAKLEVARMLIERGADLSAQDKDGQTVLHLALQAVGMKMWIPEVVELASVAELAELVGELEAEKLAELAGELEAEKLKVALMLIERGVDVSAQDKEGRTALHLASHAGRLEVAHMLIERGAAVSAQNKDGQTPLHLASEAGKLDVAHMLIEHGAGVSAQDKDDRTPIHLASQAEQLEVVCMHSADTSV